MIDCCEAQKKIPHFKWHTWKHFGIFLQLASSQKQTFLVAEDIECKEIHLFGTCFQNVNTMTQVTTTFHIFPGEKQMAHSNWKSEKMKNFLLQTPNSHALLLAMQETDFVVSEECCLTFHMCNIKMMMMKKDLTEFAAAVGKFACRQFKNERQLMVKNGTHSPKTWTWKKDPPSDKTTDYFLIFNKFPNFNLKECFVSPHSVNLFSNVSNLACQQKTII